SLLPSLTKMNSIASSLRRKLRKVPASRRCASLKHGITRATRATCENCRTVQTHTIAATVHGRFLVRAGPPERLLIGFHGFAETAEVHMNELLKIDGTDAWTIASIQALHPFYAGRSQQIGASWMTRLDRELAIADNVAYVRSVVATFHPPEKVVFAGFSQGVAMAYRA